MNPRADHAGNAGWGVKARRAMFCVALGIAVGLAGCGDNTNPAGQQSPGGQTIVQSGGISPPGSQTAPGNMPRNTFPTQETRTSDSGTLENAPAFPAPITPPVPDPFPGRGKIPFPIGPPSEPPTEPPVTEPTFPLGGGAFKYPLRITYSDTGWLLVTDTRRNQVLRVNPDTLKADQAFSVNGMPLAVGILGREIFVGIREKAAVEAFSWTGKPWGFLLQPGAVGYPADLAIDHGAGLVFVLDGKGRNVKVIRAADRAVQGVIGADTLMAPTGIAVDPSRAEVLVSDYGGDQQAARVWVFSYGSSNYGALVAELSGAGICNFFGCRNGFSRPRGPAVRNSRVYVPDVMLAKVLVFDRDSKERIFELGSGDRSISDLRIPTDVAINEVGDVFVTSPKTLSVVKFVGGAP